MSDLERFNQGLEDGRRGMASGSDDHSYQLGYQAGCAMHDKEGPQDDVTAFMIADLGLGMYEQNFAENRQQLVDYAVRQGLIWALPEFLDRRGWLDADWVVRINRQVN
ncbi:MAG: hypothetical protein WBN02_18370 [Sedimenticolaceae bacterium]